jgi:hypothetical protein
MSKVVERIDRATRSDVASREIIGKEANERDKKTARLRALRLAHEAAAPLLSIIKRRSRSARLKDVMHQAGN